jgi:hypothetical protein
MDVSSQMREWWGCITGKGTRYALNKGGRGGALDLRTGLKEPTIMETPTNGRADELGHILKLIPRSSHRVGMVRQVSKATETDINTYLDS